MIGIECIFGAVGFALGVVLATVCLVASAAWDYRQYEREMENDNKRR